MLVIHKRPQQSAFEGSLERGMFIVKKLATLNFDSLLRKVKKVARQHDKGEWHKAATRFGIDVDALRVLDSASPPIPYPLQAT